MRTTVRLDPDLLAEAKRLAAAEGRTLTSLFHEALRELMLRRAAPRAARPVELPTFSGRGLQPGVDLDDGAGLLELMEAADDPAGR